MEKENFEGSACALAFGAVQRGERHFLPSIEHTLTFSRLHPNWPCPQILQAHHHRQDGRTDEETTHAVLPSPETMLGSTQLLQTVDP